MLDVSSYVSEDIQTLNVDWRSNTLTFIGGRFEMAPSNDTGVETVREREGKKEKIA